MLLVAAALAATLSWAGAVAAVADPSWTPPLTPAQQAAAEAASIRLQVEGLTQQAVALARAADLEQAQLDAVTQSVLAEERALADLETSVTDAESALTDHIRWIYMQGPGAPLAVILSAHDLREVELTGKVQRGITTQNEQALVRADSAKRRQLGTVATLRTRQSTAFALRAKLAAERPALLAALAAQRTLLSAVSARAARLLAAEALQREVELRAEVARKTALAKAARAAAAKRVKAGPPISPVREPALPPCDLSGTSASEQYIIAHESAGIPTSQNPISTAFGLGQMLLEQRLRYLGADYATTDCGLQLGAMRAYITDRYQTAEAAEAFWRANHWY